MRILFLNHNVVRAGGTFFRALDLGRYLVKRGHLVTLLSISPHRRLRFELEKIDGVEVVHTPDLFWGMGRSGWDPWDTIRRIFYLRKGFWEIIHAWDSRPAVILPALFIRQKIGRTRCKLVIDWCDWWGRGGTQTERPGRISKMLYGPVETFFEEAFRKKADGTTVISEALYNRAIRLGVRRENIKILFQGCDIGRKLDRRRAREKMGFPCSQNLVISVGAMMPKDAALLFEVMRLFFPSMSDTQWVIIGRHKVRIPRDLLNSGKVRETGFVTEETLEDYMAACDLLFVPMADTLANRARWPSKVNPFLAAGRAVMITRVGDLPRLLEQHNAALVVGCNPEEISNELIRVLGNLEIRNFYEKQAQRVANEILLWPRVAEQLEKFYFEIINHGCVMS